jgi:hypothetical protein
VTRAVLAPVLALVALTASPAFADHRLSLTADARDTGYVGLSLHAVGGEPVSIRDETTGETRTLTPTSGDTALRRFGTWRRERGESAGDAGHEDWNPPRPVGG